jgi:hypothetical protein
MVSVFSYAKLLCMISHFLASQCGLILALCNVMLILEIKINFTSQY